MERAFRSVALPWCLTWLWSEALAAERASAWSSDRRPQLGGRRPTAWKLGRWGAGGGGDGCLVVGTSAGRLQVHSLQGTLLHGQRLHTLPVVALRVRCALLGFVDPVLGH